MHATIRYAYRCSSETLSCTQYLCVPLSCILIKHWTLPFKAERYSESRGIGRIERRTLSSVRTSAHWAASLQQRCSPGIALSPFVLDRCSRTQVCLEQAVGRHECLSDPIHSYVDPVCREGVQCQLCLISAHCGLSPEPCPSLQQRVLILEGFSHLEALSVAQAHSLHWLWLLTHKSRFDIIEYAKHFE